MLIYLPNYSKTNRLEMKANLLSYSKGSHASLLRVLGKLHSREDLYLKKRQVWEVWNLAQSQGTERWSKGTVKQG